jgi:hypothetical protein
MSAAPLRMKGDIPWPAVIATGQYLIYTHQTQSGSKHKNIRTPKNQSTVHASPL